MAAPALRVPTGRLAPLLAVGASSLIWQVASARSLLEGLRGNELGLGLVLMSWLLLVGAGSVAGARLAPARSEAALAVSLLLVPAGLLGSLALQNGPAAADPATLVGPLRTVALSLLCLAPACLLLGASFALAARAPADAPAGTWAARVFAVESLGTVAAGLLFHFLLASASLQSAGLVAGAVAWLAALPLLRAGRPGLTRLAFLAASLLGALGLMYLTPGLPLPGRHLLVPRTPGYLTLSRRISPHAALAVLARGDQLLFTANGQVVFSNQDEQRSESETHLALLAHPAPRRLLLIGGGLGGGIARALEHGLERLDYVELDPLLVELARRHLPSLEAELGDHRVRLLLGDGRQLVRKSPPAAYDVIRVALPGPGSALLNRFYTAEFFSAARRALRAGGLLALNLEGGEGYLSPAAALAHRSVLAAMRAGGLHPLALPGENTLLLGGRDAEPALPVASLLRRLADRELRPRFFGSADLVARTLPFKRELYQQALQDQSSGAGNRDLKPTAYFQASLLWLAVGSPELAALSLRLAERAWRWPWLAPLLGLTLGLGAAGLRRRRPAAGFALLAAGLTGLALELAVLLACQLARGVIYRELGLLMAAFMLGLALGAPAGRWLLAAAPRRALALALAACGGSSLLTLALLPLALRWPSAALLVLLLGLLLVGASVGACYPPAAAGLAARHGPAAPARAYAWDLLGAALGSLLAGGLALPVLGLTGTSALCAALCLGGAAGLRRSG